MGRYIFRTTTTMKEYNCKKWWIDSNIVGTVEVTADNTADALSRYCQIVNEKFGIEISQHAIKTKSPMWEEDENGKPKQVGYVLTGKTGFEDRDSYTWSMQYVDLWVNILTVVDTDF
jgi:hypothetical protein